MHYIYTFKSFTTVAYYFFSKKYNQANRNPQFFFMKNILLQVCKFLTYPGACRWIYFTLLLYFEIALSCGEIEYSGTSRDPHAARNRGIATAHANWASSQHDLGQSTQLLPFDHSQPQPYRMLQNIDRQQLLRIACSNWQICSRNRCTDQRWLRTCINPTLMPVTF